MLRSRVVTVALAVALGGVGCAGPGEPAASSSATSSSSPSAETSSASDRDRDPAALESGVVTDLEDVSRAHPDAEVSVALTRVGGDQRAQVVGEAPTLVAWSTIKVPLALAVSRSRESAPVDVDAALTASDNAAAQRLWERLGAGSTAAAAVETQLDRGGDARTTVPPEVTVAGYSAFGQAKWRLGDQATFAAALPCLPGSTAVTDAMGRVVDGQRWGLGRIDGARFKGGWGSTPGGYVVRQLGLLPGTKGETAVALQVRTGTHEQGTAIADEVADVLSRHDSDLPTGSCD